MPAWYLTPAALGYLSQFILALLIAGYFVARLIRRRASRPAHFGLLTDFLTCVALLTLLLTLDAAFSPTDRLCPLFLQTTVLALGILLLLQFAYRFPEPISHKWETRLVLALSLAYLLYEAGYAVYRFYLLSAWGYVIYRPPWADYLMALGLSWAPVVLLRQAVRVSADENLTPNPSRATRDASSPARRGEALSPPSLVGKHVLSAAEGGIGGLGPQYVDFGSLVSGGAIRGGPQGLMQNYYLDFRRHLHTLLLPLAYLIVTVSVLAVIGFSSIFHHNLVRSLDALLAGVRRVNAGDLQTTMPIHYHDEIGFLTESFNSAAARLHDQVTTLETRVAERTQALRTEMAVREAAQAQVLAQQRALAAAEERERLGRELHDGLGQVMGYLNLQAQTAETLLDRGQIAGVRTNLHQMAQAAQQAHMDVRSFILGFRAAARQSFGEALQQTVAEFERQAGIPVSLETSQSWDERWLSPVAEVDLLRIIQEALTNIRKHAQARRVILSLAQAGDRLRVAVEDDGVGFETRDWGLGTRYWGVWNGAAPAKTPKATELMVPNPQSPIPSHFGLANMHARAVELCGSLIIESTLGQGTRVSLKCPIQAPREQAAMPASPLRVLLVADHPMFLDGLRNLLAAHGMEVVGLGQDGLEAQTLARALRPDLIVMDLQMPRCDGLEATRRIKAEWPEARIVILTVSAAEEHLFAALQAGAAGYLLKSLNAEEFFLLLAGLEHGAPPIAPELAARIRGELGQAASQRGQLAALSPIESELLRLVAQGLTYREVARQLHLSEPAVKYHMKQILEHLHLANRVQAEAYARRSGLGG